MRIGRFLLPLIAVLMSFVALPLLALAPPRVEVPVVVFRDVGEEAGLFPHLAGSRGHAAAWGDVDGDGWPDLFVGTYANSGKPGQLLLNKKGKFRLDPQVRIEGCASGALFVDLDNTGRLDLYVSCNAHGKAGARARPSVLFRNDGKGKLTDVSKDSGACPPRFMGRTVAAADFDGDGKLDLLVCEFYYAPTAKKGLALYRNKGGHVFEDVTKAVGLPVGKAVAGIAVADVNNDGWPDIFLTSPDGDNRLYLNDGKGRFREAPGTREVFAWKVSAADTPAGVCIADVNGDGLPDIVVGHHFKAPWKGPTSVRLYLNKGARNGAWTFEDVTDAAGLTKLAMKAPHVEIQDFDNDGRPDIYVSIVKFKDGRPHPVIYRNLGAKGGVPQFRDDAWSVNDFPTAADRGVRRTNDFFAKLLKDKKVIYSAAAPSVDYDGDGRLDLLVTMWWEEARTLLLRNETASGNFLDVRVTGDRDVNRMGIGSVIRVYPAGKLGRAADLLGCREIAIGYGWCSGQEAIAHFGLGKVGAVDVEVTLPHGQGKVVRKGVKANQRITVKR